MNSEEMREEFEAWAVEELGLPTRRVARGDYQSFGMSMAWKAWRASRAAVAPKANSLGLAPCVLKEVLDVLKGEQ